MKTRGRPPKYTDDTRVRLRATGASQLRPSSDRRAIVTWLLDHNGTASLKEIDDHFGYTVRDRVLALVRAGWLEIVS